MNDHDPMAIIGRAIPEDPPPANFDLDRIVSDGYRARRRHRAVLGGAATAGVAALAGALALAVGLNPGADGGVEAAEQFDFDPATAAYPYDEHWGAVQDPEDGSWAYETGGEADEVAEAATTAFGPLLDEAGLWDDALNTSEAEDCEMFEESATEVYNECLDQPFGLPYQRNQTPAADGQGYLRSYWLYAGDEEADAPAFTAEAMLPGGWTAEPGPVGANEFPQHLVDDEGAEFTTEEFEDGRTLMVADRGCVYDLAVVYPNESALRVSWDTGCEGEQYPVDLGELTDAALSMPEFAFDTGGLAPVDELPEPPDGWPADDGWAEGAQADAVATGEAVEEALTGLYPGADVIDESVGASAPEEADSTVLHQYSMTATLPFEAFAGEGDAHVNVTYTLPGGWTPWTPDLAEGEGGHLPDCDGKLGIDCAQVDVDGRTAVVEVDPESGVYEVTVFDEDGWAVNLFMTFEGEFDLTVEEFTELAAAMPAPVHDEEAAQQD
ncbi:hypothetical protein [Glycomyces tenuis]|uniref:hypothetical protein n=1 Tax=Glycomyces tenuis TaxID=58116 RepID=UPI00042A16F0|nr:hypothetical protein [Glycomyces tenuis]